MLKWRSIWEGGVESVCVEDAAEMKGTVTSWMDRELPLLTVAVRFSLALLKRNGCAQPSLTCVLSHLVWRVGIQIGQVMHSPFKGRPLPFSFALSAHHSSVRSFFVFFCILPEFESPVSLWFEYGVFCPLSFWTGLKINLEKVL